MAGFRMVPAGPPSQGTRNVPVLGNRRSPDQSLECRTGSHRRLQPQFAVAILERREPTRVENSATRTQRNPHGRLRRVRPLDADRFTPRRAQWEGTGCAAGAPFTSRGTPWGTHALHRRGMSAVRRQRAFGPVERTAPHVVNCRIARPQRATAKRVTQRCGPVRTRLERREAVPGAVERGCRAFAHQFERVPRALAVRPPVRPPRRL
jgi:hypothetical protein